MSAYATHFSPTPTLTLPRSRLGLPYWALSVGVHLAVLAAGSALLPPSTPAALTLTVALAPAQAADLGAPSIPPPPPTLRHSVGGAAPVARPATTPSFTQSPSSSTEPMSPLPVMAASSEPVSGPAPVTAPSLPAAAETPLADSQWLSSTVTQRMNARKRYPRLAQRLGLEGRVLIEAQINDRGQLVAAQITESSGHDMLDQDALALLKNVTPLDLPGVRLASLTRVVIPLRYRLE